MGIDDQIVTSLFRVNQYVICVFFLNDFYLFIVFFFLFCLSNKLKIRECSFL